MRGRRESRGRDGAQPPPKGVAEGRRRFPSARRTRSGARRSLRLGVLLRRYGPLDLAATAAALALAACLPCGVGGAFALALPCAALESLVFYSLAFLRERRANARAGVLARLLREYAPAEALDLWARPTAMAIALGSLPHPVLAVLVGSLGADALFYLTAARSWSAQALRSARRPADRAACGAPPGVPRRARALSLPRE